MLRLIGFSIAGALCLAGCTKGSSAMTPEQLARISPDLMGPVNDAKADLKKAEDEVARTDQALKSSQDEVDIAKKEVDVAKAQTDETKAVLNKANFDHNSEAGKKALYQQTLNQAQQDAAQAHVKAANTGVDMAKAQKKVVEAEREYAQAKLDLTAAEALKASDPGGKNANIDSLRSKMGDQLKQVEHARNDVTKLQTQAEVDRIAWQDANQRLNEMRGKGGSAPH